MSADSKEIGKLKKGTKFHYYGETQIYKIILSGHGRVEVYFEKVNSIDSSTYSTVHKKNKVVVVK